METTAGNYTHNSAPIRNIIFDFDGTLADTSQLIVATMQKSIDDMQLPFRNEEEIKATIGVRLEEIPSILWPMISGLGDSFAKTYRNNFEIIKDKIPIILFPKVKDTLKRLREENYYMVIATSRSHRSLEELSNMLGIKDFFSYLLGGDDVDNGKPNPESIYKIIEKMDWKPEETMMVGDMKVDILMGKNAGIRTCAVTYGNGKERELEEACPDWVVESFNELRIKLLSVQK